jgi:hypothetical protein
MDPNFIPIVFSLRERSQLLDLAKQQASEEHQKQMFLEMRRKTLEFARTESNKLLQDTSATSQQIYIRCQILLYQLNNVNAKPDAFDDQVDKENSFMLWNQLVGIADKYSKLLTTKQLEQCHRCLEAIWMENLLRTAAEHLEEFNKFQAMKNNLIHKKEVNQRIERIIYGILAPCLIFGIWLISSNHPGDIFTSILTFLLLFGLLPAYFISYGFSIHQLRLGKTIKTYDQEQNGTLWHVIKEKFNGIPTQAEIKQKWEEQVAIIRDIFGESS